MKSASKKLLTRIELARRARVGESTLHGYLRRYPGRIPARGRRFPESAIAVVRQIRNENLRRKRKQRQGYYTLKDISRLTGISQTTLQKYQKEHGGEIPSEGQGRRRMYPRESIRLFRRYRQMSRRGPSPSSDSLVRRIESLERTLQQLLREIRSEKRT